MTDRLKSIVATGVIIIAMAIILSAPLVYIQVRVWGRGVHNLRLAVEQRDEHIKQLELAKELAEGILNRSEVAAGYRITHIDINLYGSMEAAVFVIGDNRMRRIEIPLVKLATVEPLVEEVKGMLGMGETK